MKGSWVLMEGDESQKEGFEKGSSLNKGRVMI
jgi:hypothetical protein